MVHGYAKAAPVTRTTSRITDSVPSALSAVHAIGTQMRDLIKKNRTDSMAYGGINKKMDAAVEFGRNSTSKIEIQP